MTANDQTQLGNTLWKIADELRGAMNADDFPRLYAFVSLALFERQLRMWLPKRN